MKRILCTLAVVLLIGAFTVHPADAACWWNGWGWECWHPWHPYYWRSAYWHPYWHPYWHGGWGWHHWRHW